MSVFTLMTTTIQMVTGLAKMMHERLVLFKARSGKLPVRVLVYRDGVSEVRDF